MRSKCVRVWSVSAVFCAVPDRFFACLSEWRLPEEKQVVNESLAINYLCANRNRFTYVRRFSPSPYKILYPPLIFIQDPTNFLDTAHGNKKPFVTNIKVYTCIDLGVGRWWRRRGREIGVNNFTYAGVAVYFTHFEESCIETLVV